MTKILLITPPAGWRIGQTLFNFLEWLRIEKGYDSDAPDGRQADTFNMSDGEIIKYYQEYLTTLK